MGRHLAKRRSPYVHALAVKAMGRIWRITDLAPNHKKETQSSALFASGVLRIIGASGATQIATILPMRTQSGAMFVWKSGANALAAMASLHHMDRQSVNYMVKTRQHSVSCVVNLGNVRCANLKSAPKFDGLLVKMFA